MEIYRSNKDCHGYTIRVYLHGCTQWSSIKHFQWLHQCQHYILEIATKLRFQVLYQILSKTFKCSYHSRISYSSNHSNLLPTKVYIIAIAKTFLCQIVILSSMLEIMRTTLCIRFLAINKAYPAIHRLELQLNGLTLLAAAVRQHVNDSLLVRACHGWRNILLPYVTTRRTKTYPVPSLLCAMPRNLSQHRN